MRHELSFLGALYPSLLVCALIAVALWAIADRVMLRIAGWRFFWHPPLARLALFLVLFGAVSAAYPDF